MENEELKNLIKKRRLYHWEIAREIGASEFTLSRWLRGGLSEEKQKKILEAIDKLSNLEKEDKHYD